MPYGQAADPGLDAEPAAGHTGAQEGRQVGAPDSERGAGHDRVGDPVLRPSVADQEHRDQDDRVGDADREDRLDPVHPERDQAGGQRPRRDVD